MAVRAPAPFDGLAAALRQEANAALSSLLEVGASQELLPLGGTTVLQVKLKTGANPLEAVRQLERLSLVEWASPNYVYASSADFTPNDPRYTEQYHHALMQNNLAWDTTLGISSIIIAITDTGVDYTHPDLAPNIWRNPGEFPDNGIDDDGNGFIDDVRGWDFVNNDNDPQEVDDDHGTHTSSIAAARTNNGIGVAGTAGGATIMPIRIGGSPTSAIYAGTYRYAADNGARIVSTSFNIDSFVDDPAFRAAVQYMYDRGVLHFNSAGNNSELNPPRQAFDFQLFVASTDSADLKSDFSNFGFGIDIAAPGSDILSTFPGGGYVFNSGTSMATPNAAGAAALIWSAHPDWTREQVAAQLIGTADNIDALNPSFAGLLGPGRVNSFRAVTETLLPPRIKAVVGLPSEAGTATGPIPSFSVDLANILDPATVALTNFELRSDGPDDLFDTSDDVVIPLALPPGFTYRVGTNRLTFTVQGSLAEEHYRFRVVSGGLRDPFGSPLDGNGDGTGGDHFERIFFTPDLTPPRVVSTSVQEGDALPAGSLTYVVQFSQPMRTANLDNSDFSLVGLVRNHVYVPASRGYDDAGMTLTITYANLPDDRYTLTLLSGNGRFENGLGIDLDGEPSAFPIPPNQSGDGVEGGNFVVNFTVDVEIVPYPVLLAAQSPVGSLVYAPAGPVGGTPVASHIYELNGSFADALGGPALVPNGGTLGPTGYTFATGQGPNLSNAVNPTTYSIEMVFHIDSTSSYRKLLDFKNRTADAGLYNLSGALDFFPQVSGPSGAFTAGQLHHLVVTRDGATGRFVGYVDGVQQLAFTDSGGLATFTGPGNIIHFLRDDGSEHPSGFLDRVRIYDSVLTPEQVGTLFSTPEEGFGIISSAGDTDSFTLSVDPGQTITVVVRPTTGGLQPAVELFQDDALVGSVTAAPGQQAVLQTIHTGDTLGEPAAARTYRIAVRGIGEATGPYTVQIILNAAVEEEDHGGLVNDTQALAQDLEPTFLSLHGDEDDPRPARGAVLGRIGIAATDQDFYQFTLHAGERATLALGRPTAGNVDLELQDADGTWLAIGRAAANGDEVISNFVASAAGTYYARVTGTAGTIYNLVVTRNAVFDTEPNHPLANAQELPGTPAAARRWALGHVGPADPDFYRVVLLAGSTLEVATATPAQGDGEFGNALDLMVRLYQADGTLVAEDDNGSDGRNARLIYVVPEGAGGAYLIEVLPSAATVTPTSGEYILQVQGAETDLPPFQVTATSPADGARVRGPLTEVTVDFSDNVLVSSLDASDLTVGGVPAASFTVVDGDTVRFTLPGGLAEGFHELRIAAGAVQDVQGTPADAVTVVFYHDITPPRVVFIAPPPPTVLLPGDVTLGIVFSEPLREANLDPTDFSLVGVFTGPQSPVSFAYFGGGTVLILTYANLPEDRYTLTLLSADGRFEDLAGFNLDGSPSFPLPSGDGVEGGNFVTTLDVDFNTAPFPAALTAQPPLGSLVYASGSVSAGVPAASHVYELDGTFADALGGPGLVPNGGTLGPTGYTFAAGQGPNLSNAINPATYSIEMVFRIDSTSSFRKLLDFKNRTADDGLYNQDGALRFYPDSGPAGVFTAGQLHHLVATRDGATNRFVAYVDGVQRISFIDSTGRGVFSGPGNIIHFLRDDGSEHPSGFLDRVRIYDVVLTPEQVLTLSGGGPPPEDSGVIVPADDTDSFTLAVDPGQTISVVVTPITAALRPTVTVTGPGIDPGTATAPAAGGKAVLNAPGITLGGTYTITVGSVGGAGRYNVQIVLGAVLELEAHDQPGDNNTPASAQDIDPAFTPLLKGATRGAVLGRTDSSPTPDYYAFTVGEGELVTLALAGLTSTNVNLELRDGSDGTVASGEAGAANADRFIYNVALPAGTYFARVTGSANTNYTLVVTRGAVFEREGNDTPNEASDFTGTVGGLGHVGPDEDWYSVSLAAGQTMVFETRTPGDGLGEFGNLLDPHIELYDPDGNLVAVGVPLDDGRNEIITFTAPVDGVYRIRVTPEGDTRGEYFLDPVVLPGATIPVPTRAGAESPARGRPAAGVGEEVLFVTSLRGTPALLPAAHLSMALTSAKPSRAGGVAPLVGLTARAALGPRAGADGLPPTSARDREPEGSAVQAREAEPLGPWPESGEPETEFAPTLAEMSPETVERFWLELFEGAALGEDRMPEDCAEDEGQSIRNPDLPPISGSWLVIASTLAAALISPGSLHTRDDRHQRRL